MRDEWGSGDRERGCAVGVLSPLGTLTLALVCSDDDGTAAIANLAAGVLVKVTGLVLLCVGVARARMTGEALCPGVDIDLAPIDGGTGDLTPGVTGAER